MAKTSGGINTTCPRQTTTLVKALLQVRQPRPCPASRYATAEARPKARPVDVHLQCLSRAPFITQTHTTKSGSERAEERLQGQSYDKVLLRLNVRLNLLFLPPSCRHQRRQLALLSQAQSKATWSQGQETSLAQHILIPSPLWVGQILRTTACWAAAVNRQQYLWGDSPL